MQAFVRSLNGSPVAFDPVHGIELHEAEWVALLYNPDLRLARADEKVAQALAEHAGLWEDPTISLDVLRIVGGGLAGEPWIVGSALSVTLPLSGRLERARALAGAESEVALLRVLEQERETVAQLRIRWLEWSLHHHRAALIDDLLAELDSIAATAARLAELGEMLRSEASLFAIEQTSRQIERDVLIARQGAVEADIRAIMGLSPAAPLRPVPKFSFMASVAEGDPDVLERMNPQLARLRSAYAAAEERLHLEVRKQYPDIVFGPQHERESGQSRIGFIGAIPLPILNANRQGIAEAAAARERARTEFETAYERLVGRVSVLGRMTAAAGLEQRQLESRLAPLVDRQVSEAKRLFEMGEGNPLALLEGTVRRHEAKLRVLEARAAEAEANIELTRLLGDAAHVIPGSVGTACRIGDQSAHLNRTEANQQEEQP